MNYFEACRALAGARVIEAIKNRLMGLEVDDFVNLYNSAFKGRIGYGLGAMIYPMTDACEWQEKELCGEGKAVLREIYESHLEGSWDWSDDFIGKGELTWFTFSDTAEVEGLAEDLANRMWDCYSPNFCDCEEEKKFWDRANELGVHPEVVLCELAGLP